MIAVHKLGFHVRSPKEVVAKVQAFNRMRKARGGEEAELAVDNLDIKDFFTHIPRDELRRVVNHYQKLTLENDPSAIYF